MNALSFMTHPLPRRIFEILFFVVDVPVKPYYNPANLEKVGCGVKQKEFIHTIGQARRGSPAAHQRSSPPRRYFLFRSTRVGDTRPRHAAAHPEPLPPLQRIRRALAP